ncbi:MAG: APC family permease [Streptosporangiaceae bacterium]
MSELASTGLNGSATSPQAPTPVRDFTLRSAFALAFSDVSPIVGIYSVLAISLIAAGPIFFWAFPIVLAGQLLVTGVFGELVSKWPFQGSVYAWARELIGPRYGWFTGWAYMWGLTLVLSALALAAAQFLLGAFGEGSPGYGVTVATALGVLIFGSVANMIGRQLLKTLLYISMTCELIASLGIGAALLFFHRTHSFSFLFTSAGTGHGTHWLFSSFFGVVAFIGFSFLGFESAGSIAEEVQGARRVLPKAITLSLLAAGILVMFASLGIVLSVPDIAAVISGHDANPIATTLETRLGSATGKVLLVMLTVGFTASLIGVQAAVTRAIWANARHKVLPGSKLLGKLSGHDNLPRYAIGLTALIAGSLLFISSSKIYSLLLSFGNAGFYISYALPVTAAAYLRWRGRWKPGDFTMGRWSNVATYVAAAWITLEAINIAWPRAIYGAWYLNWGLLIMTGILGVLGVAVSARVFRNGDPGAMPLVPPAPGGEGS